jgi:APA family basic amino acid/polyamine antiporter
MQNDTGNPTEISPEIMPGIIPGIKTDEKKLSRSLTLLPTTTLVIGCVIGAGIFVSPAGMARAVNSAPLLMLAWIVGGIMTMLGALTQCELASQSPVTGGLYEYLLEAYGRTTAFFYGWANLMIAGSGAIAAIAFMFAVYLGEFVQLPHLSPAWESVPLNIPLAGTLYPFKDFGVKMVGTALIVFLTVLNVRGVKLGARVQTLSTMAKVLAIILVIAVVFIFGHGSLSHLGSSLSTPGQPRSWTATLGIFSIALSSAFWAYDGWGNVSYIAGEVKTPEKTIPRAIILGTLIFTSLYLIINVAYLYILPVGELGAVPQDRVASAVMSSVIGGKGAMLIAGLILLSAFDATNSTILTNARVYFAMAAQGMFVKRAADAHPRFKTPHIALILQGVWSVVLILTGSFDIITGMYVFVNWLMYVLMGLAVFILRRRDPLRVRPFRMPGYPWVPLVYTVFAAAYVVVTFMGDVSDYRSGAIPFMQSIMGLILVFGGYPFFLFFTRKRA